MKLTLMAAFVMVAMSFGTLSAKPAKITVDGKCNMCKNKIEKAAKGVKGVKTAVWDKESKVLTIDYNEKLTDVKTIEKAVANIGYNAGEEKANTEARKKLPACCTSDAKANHHKDGGCSK
ncbi:MAG: heavy metal-associated domain-containing protein [Bacteroidota bacterium]|nr:heavy metal-associated domain-containing protein [Bacteroidota bacterium]